MKMPGPDIAIAVFIAIVLLGSLAGAIAAFVRQ